MDRKDYLNKVSYVYAMPSSGQILRIKEILNGMKLFYEFEDFEPYNKLILLSSEYFDKNSNIEFPNCLKFMDSGGASLYSKDKFINPMNVALNQIKFKADARFILDIIPYKKFERGELERLGLYNDTKSIEDFNYFKKCLNETIRNIEIMLETYDDNKDRDIKYILYGIIHGTNLDEKKFWLKGINNVFDFNYYAFPVSNIPTTNKFKLKLKLKGFFNELDIIKNLGIDNIHIFGIGSHITIILTPILRQIFNIITFDSLSWYKNVNLGSKLFFFPNIRFAFGRQIVSGTKWHDLNDFIPIEYIPKFCFCPYCKYYHNKHDNKVTLKNMKISNNLETSIIYMHNGLLFSQLQILVNELFRYCKEDIEWYFKCINKIFNLNLSYDIVSINENSKSLLDY